MLYGMIVRLVFGSMISHGIAGSTEYINIIDLYPWEEHSYQKQMW